MKLKKVLLLSFSLLLLLPAVTRAYWVWSPEQGKFINPEGAAEDSADEDYNRALKLYKDKNLKAAEEKIRDLLKKNPNAKIAPEALYRLGIIYEEKGDYLKAFKQYKKLVESYPGTERFNEVIEREFRIGNVFFSGKKAKFAGLEILPSLPQAAQVFEHIGKSAPFSEYGDKALFQLGLTYKKMGQFGKSVEAFQSLIDQHPQSELVPQARFQLADTSFKKSAVQNRDQRALDDASRQVDRFLNKYGDTESAEDAAKIRQAIDEKNAEKNYRTGAYYEKENYLDSALIYYADVSSRYPNTTYGKKAAEKLKSLKEPASYLNSQEKEIQEEESVIKARLKGLTDQDKEEKDRLKRKLERVEQHHKSLSKNKKESMERRRDDIARRQRELKEKFKNLDEKRKLLKKNPSEDLKRAIDRWHASLVQEQEDLDKEKLQVKEWSEELGLPAGNKMDFLPFMGEGPTPLEKVRRIEAKKLYKLSEEKKSLLEEKELLYKHHQEVSSLLNEAAPAASAELSGKEWDKLVQSDKSLAEAKSNVDRKKEELDKIEKELREKSRQYEKKFGKPDWLSSGVNAIGKSLDKSLDLINPFGDKKQPVTDQQKLLEQQMHLNEKIAAEESIVQTLNEAFNAQLALQEQRRLLAGIHANQAEPSREELGKLRKDLKTLEKKIRADYQEIQDRHQKKSKMLEQLDSLLKENQRHENPAVHAGRIAVSPVIGAARLGKAFLFGLEQKDVQVTKEASKAAQKGEESPQIAELRKNIELESLLIEAKSRELVNKQKELDILKAKASLMGGYKFRPAFVKVPYLFIDEAIDSAKRLVPKKDREELLINRIHEETSKLEALKTQAAELDKKIGPAAPASVPAPPAAAAPPAETSKPDQNAGQNQLQTQIEALQEQLRATQKDYEAERGKLEEKIADIQKQPGVKAEARPAKSGSKKEKKLRKELQEIESDLKDLIEKEKKLEGEEAEVLEKRIEKIDRVMKGINSRVLSQDLLTERDRMESRLSQIESRKDFLTKELDRFHIAEGTARS